MRMGIGSYFLGTDHGISTHLGNFSSVAGGTYIHGPDDHACIHNRKLVSTFDFGGWGVDFTRSGEFHGDVMIGNDVWVGEFAQIMSGVIIGDGAIIGAHTVIGKDVPPFAVVVGNPFQIKRYRFSNDIIVKLLEIKWWNWDERTVRERLQDFRDIDKFVEKYG